MVTTKRPLTFVAWYLLFGKQTMGNGNTDEFSFTRSYVMGHKKNLKVQSKSSTPMSKASRIRKAREGMGKRPKR
jgi:hypothetical protein